MLECERLGLEFTTITGPGWTGSGGPWIEVGQSMPHLVPVSVDTKGPAKFNQVLPKPQPQVSPYHEKQTPEMREGLAAFYEAGGIKHYSGIATYRKTFDSPRATGGRLVLDLGTVHEIACGRLNGRDLGTVWCAPWQVDISDAVKEGTNDIEIEAANLWPNRLIGDAGKPQAERLTWTIVAANYQADSELPPSGLLGPVRILTGSP